MNNPYEVLGLDPEASPEEVVRQAGRLRQRAGDERAVARIRQAVQDLTAAGPRPALLALLAHPAPVYQWPAVEAFVAAHCRPPTSSAPSSVPPLLPADVETMLGPALAAELSVPRLTFTIPTGDDSSEEVHRQTLEGVWQAALSLNELQIAD